MEIQLPKPTLVGEKSLEECIYKRESVRSYSHKKIEIPIMSIINEVSQELINGA